MYDYNVSRTRTTGRVLARRQRRIWTLPLLLVLVAALGFSASRLLPLATMRAADKTAPTIALTLPDRATPTAALPGKVSSNRIPFEPKTIPIAERRGAVADEASHGTDWQRIIVAPGDNLSLIFGRHGFSKSDLHRILETGGAAKNLRSIKPGQEVRVRADADGRVLGLTQELDYLRSLHVVSDNDGYSASIVEIEPEIKYASVLAKIKQSLFLDGQAAGLADKTIMEITDIFGWDIDFVLDVRAGDQFSVVHEEIFKEGEKVKNGKILAAEFVNRGKKLRAVYYANTDGHAGYYSDTGKAMRKAFLRAPVNFTRISSRFNLRRRHPVLNTIRAHKGVDYAAPHGTPIRATANGKITHAATKGGYGRTVVIQHGESYSTLFAHMSRYARGIKKGAKVKQGQTIGYVGKTGLATGPHLHYEFRVNGVHRNPLKIALPQSLPIDAKYIADFQAKAAPLLAQLDELGDSAKSEKLVAEVDPNVGLASSNPSPSKTQ